MIITGFKALIAAFIAFILAIIFIPIGLIYNTILSLTNLNNLGKYWLNFWYQIWLVITRFYFYIGLSIDYLGNVICGDLLLKIITNKEWYKEHKSKLISGKAGITLSSAIGQAEYHDGLNSKGIWLSNVLNKAFNEKAHAIDSYLRYLHNQTFKLK